MSILDIAAGPAERKQSGPVQFTSVREPVFDATTGRTYQLIARVSDDVPHTLSCLGNQRSPLDALNTTRRLTHERNALGDDKSASVTSKREALSEQIKAQLSVNVDRTDRTARMLQCYASKGIS